MKTNLIFTKTMKLIENITKYLIETEVKQLLGVDSNLHDNWVDENYNAIYCEESIFGGLDSCIKNTEVYSLALTQILNDYCDDKLDFSYIAEEVRKEFAKTRKLIKSESIEIRLENKSKSSIVQDNTGYYRTIKAVNNE